MLSLGAVFLLLVGVAGLLFMTKVLPVGGTGGCVQSYTRDSTTRAYSCSY